MFSALIAANAGWRLLACLASISVLSKFSTANIIIQRRERTRTICRLLVWPVFIEAILPTVAITAIPFMVLLAVFATSAISSRPLFRPLDYILSSCMFVTYIVSYWVIHRRVQRGDYDMIFDRSQSVIILPRSVAPPTPSGNQTIQFHDVLKTTIQVHGHRTTVYAVHMTVDSGSHIPRTYTLVKGLPLASQAQDLVDAIEVHTPPSFQP